MPPPPPPSGKLLDPNYVATSIPNQVKVYNLCLYAGLNSQFDVLSADVASLGVCGEGDCWNATLDGYLYRDALGSSYGVRTLRLAVGIDGTSRLYARGAGSNLILPKGPLLAPVIVQLAVADGQAEHCWQSTFSDFVRNDGRVLRAQGD